MEWGVMVEVGEQSPSEADRLRILPRGVTWRWSVGGACPGCAGIG